MKTRFGGTCIILMSKLWELVNYRAHTLSRGSSAAQFLVTSINEGQVLPFFKMIRNMDLGAEFFKDLNVASKKLEKMCRLNKIYV